MVTTLHQWVRLHDTYPMFQLCGSQLLSEHVLVKDTQFNTGSIC